MVAILSTFIFSGVRGLADSKHAKKVDRRPNSTVTQYNCKFLSGNSGDPDPELSTIQIKSYSVNEAVLLAALAKLKAANYPDVSVLHFASDMNDPSQQGQPMVNVTNIVCAPSP